MFTPNEAKPNDNKTINETIFLNDIYHFGKKSLLVYFISIKQIKAKITIKQDNIIR